MLKWQHGRNRAGLTIWHMDTHMATHMAMVSWHGFFSNLRWHDFYEKHTARLPQWYEEGYWVWQRGRCLFLFVVGRLLRTIHTAGRISEHEFWLGPTSGLAPHTVYSFADFQSSNHNQLLLIQPHQLLITLHISHIFYVWQKTSLRWFN